ncbi:MAG TPA: phosphoglycolate phosphatase [Nitrososphaerales archaeon]|nr:phosphoglycolate phosphatase [Nitrososphaerales archaeon]
MAFKAFVLDIDGTIVDYDGILNLEAVNSIRWLRKLGYEVLLASGRGPWDTYYLGVFIGCTKVAVCENGGVLMTSPSDLKLYTDKTKSLEAYDCLCKNIQDVKVKPVSARLTEVVLLRTFDGREGQKVLDDAAIPVTIHDSKFALHLTRKGIEKSLALGEALRYLGVLPEETIVIGDSETDVPMFRMCGYSLAVSNAPEDVKSEAKHVCTQEIGNGTVEAIAYCAKSLL